MADTVRRKVVVHGDVQGVSFRDATAKEASSQGVAGWVRNRDDGTVEAVFEGDSVAVDGMVQWCDSGPSAASVERIETSDEEPEGESGFEQR